MLLLGSQAVLLSTLRESSSFAAVLLASVPMVAIAWWLPAAFADAWFEFVHERAFGREPLPARRFAVGSLGALIAVAAATALFGLITYGMMEVSSYWAVGAAAITLLLFGLFLRLEPTMTTVTHGVSELEAIAASDLDRLAVDSGIQPVTFARMSSDSIEGLNAVTTGAGNERRIILTEDLLAADERLRRHIVAHELAHLGRGHVRIAAVVTSLIAGAAVLCLGLLVSWGRPFEVLGLSDPTDPRGLPTMVGLIGLLALLAVPVLAWLGRAHERQADEVAFRLGGPIPLPLLRQLHVTDRADLDPGFLARVMASHPAPAERLDLARRIA